MDDVESGVSDAGLLCALLAQQPFHLYSNPARYGTLAGAYVK